VLTGLSAYRTTGDGNISGSDEQELSLGIVNDASGVASIRDEASNGEGQTRIELT
jgi:hypothetical protein